MPKAPKQKLSTINSKFIRHRIQLVTDEKLGTDVCTVVAECLSEDINKEQLIENIRAALREELQVTPRIDLVKFGSLERATFKAKRLEDKRKKA